jgi:hypothetical protein
MHKTLGNTQTQTIENRQLPTNLLDKPSPGAKTKIVPRGTMGQNSMFHTELFHVEQSPIVR